MKKAPDKKRKLIEKAEKVLDIKGGLLQDLPNITLYGTSSAEIDNFKGLLDFSKTSIRVNTTDGILRLDGSDLSISVMTDENLCVNGKIKNLSFE